MPGVKVVKSILLLTPFDQQPFDQVQERKMGVFSIQFLTVSGLGISTWSVTMKCPPSLSNLSFSYRERPWRFSPPPAQKKGLIPMLTGAVIKVSPEFLFFSCYCDWLSGGKQWMIPFASITPRKIIRVLSRTIDSGRLPFLGTHLENGGGEGLPSWSKTRFFLKPCLYLIFMLLPKHKQWPKKNKERSPPTPGENPVESLYTHFFFYFFRR